MSDAIIIQNLGKRFRRYHHDKPATLHEALMRGFRKLGPSEYFWGLQDINVRIAAGRSVAVIGPQWGRQIDVTAANQRCHAARPRERENTRESQGFA
jgi:hypothetical protein